MAKEQGNPVSKGTVKQKRIPAKPIDIPATEAAGIAVEEKENGLSKQQVKRIQEVVKASARLALLWGVKPVVEEFLKSIL